MITAGSMLHVYLAPMDAFKNPTPSQSTLPTLPQVMGGPTLCQLSKDEAKEQLQADSQLSDIAANPHGLVFGAIIERAGSVMVNMTVAGQAVSNGWPKALMVLPASPNAAHCFLGNHHEVRYFLISVKACT